MQEDTSGRKRNSQIASGLDCNCGRGMYVFGSLMDVYWIAAEVILKKDTVQNSPQLRYSTGKRVN